MVKAKTNVRPFVRVPFCTVRSGTEFSYKGRYVVKVRSKLVMTTKGDKIEIPDAELVTIPR